MRPGHVVILLAIAYIVILGVSVPETLITVVQPVQVADTYGWLYVAVSDVVLIAVPVAVAIFGLFSLEKD